jgi:hypothetical protein
MLQKTILAPLKMSMHPAAVLEFTYGEAGQCTDAKWREQQCAQQVAQL